jgi:hypothetical protein
LSPEERADDVVRRLWMSEEAEFRLLNVGNVRRAIEQAEKDATARSAQIAERFAHGIVDRGDMECCGSNEQAWLIERSREIAAAIRESPRPAPALCGVVGHPGSGRMVCEREPHEAGTYHQQGAVRWLGYERPAPEPDPKEGE